MAFSQGPIAHYKAQALVGITLELKDRRIEFEGFSLVEDGVARTPHSQEVFDLLVNAFPTAIGVYLPMVFPGIRPSRGLWW